MEELFEAMEDPEFMFFIDDYSSAAHDVAEFGGKPFMQRLVETMEMNRDD